MLEKLDSRSYKALRNKQKRELWGRFELPAVQDVYRDKLYGLFDRRCFRCGMPEHESLIGQVRVLCIDHHVPMILGGRLEPGNLVALCRSCNGYKRDIPPDLYYKPDELERLSVLLAMQEDLFRFKFDWDAWAVAPAAYLVGLGVDPELVHALLHDEEHPNFIGMPGRPNAFSFTIGLDLNGLDSGD